MLCREVIGSGYQLRPVVVIDNDPWSCRDAQGNPGAPNDMAWRQSFIMQAMTDKLQKECNRVLEVRVRQSWHCTLLDNMVRSLPQDYLLCLMQGLSM